MSSYLKGNTFINNKVQLIWQAGPVTSYGLTSLVGSISMDGRLFFGRIWPSNDM